MTPFIWLGTTHPCNPPNYGLWVNLHFSSGYVFINIVFCPCYLFLLWNVVLKCLALCLITIIAACFLHLYACLTCSSVVYMPYLFTHCLPTIIYSVLCWCLLRFNIFYFCYMLHFFVTPFWLLCVHIFSFVSIFVSFSFFLNWLADVFLISWLYCFFCLYIWHDTDYYNCQDN